MLPHTDGGGIGNNCDPDIAMPNDCVVNALDLGALKNAFFTTPEDPLWNPDADFNGDDVVNALDLGTLKAGFFTPPGPSGVANLCADPTVIAMEIGPGIDDLPEQATCTVVGSGISCLMPVGQACTPGKGVQVDASITASPNGPSDFVKGRALCGGLVVADTQPATGPAPFATTASGFQTTRAASCELVAQIFPGVQGTVTCTFQ